MTSDMIFLRLVHPLFGQSETEVVGQSALLFVHPDDRDSVRRVFCAVSSGSSPAGTCQCRIRGRNGEWPWVEVEMTDLMDDPLVHAILFNYRAIPAPSPEP